MNIPNENSLIKMAADSIDLVILRQLVAASMSRKKALNRERLQRLEQARDMLVELYMEVGLEALHGERT